MKKVLLIAAATLMVGCTTNITHQVNTNEPDPAVVRLTQVADSIQQQANELANIKAAEYAEKYPGKAYKGQYKVPGMSRIVSLGGDWHGPLDEVVMKLSSLAGYGEPKILGKKPAGDVMVSIKSEYRPIIDILHDAGTQAGDKAIVTVRAKSQIIEIEYAKY